MQLCYNTRNWLKNLSVSINHQQQTEQNTVQQYKEVSGLSLNLKICMFILVNMTQQNKDYIVRSTNMRNISMMKHLLVILNGHGELTYEDNILPIEKAIRQIIHTLSSSTFTPISLFKVPAI